MPLPNLRRLILMNRWQWRWRQALYSAEFPGTFCGEEMGYGKSVDAGLYSYASPWPPLQFFPWHFRL